MKLTCLAGHSCAAAVERQRRKRRNAKHRSHHLRIRSSMRRGLRAVGRRSIRASIAMSAARCGK
jgi:hypothetical protein